MSFLLSSVFRPFGVDDAYGRKENKLELFHNQVTREQGIFSLRFNHRSFGLYFIAENIQMPTRILDFPSLDEFTRELRRGYDYVGISFITPNFVKAKKMAERVRQVAPASKIILGGHGTSIPNIEELIPCDHVIRGEGIVPLRALFGEDVDAPIHHPDLPSAEHKRILGVPFPASGGVLIPGVGCPNACRFCATSHFFEKKYTPYLRTGQEIFDAMRSMTRTLKTREFFVMDENFLKHKDRALELMRLVEKSGEPYIFSIFSSAEAILEFGIENMVRLGVGYVWIGVESQRCLFEKTRGVDVKALIADLHRHGIFVLASSILFLEHHTQENIWEDIDFAIGLNPDFSQFMQLGPLPQTQLYLDYKAQGKLLEDIPYEEWHGQKHIWFEHPHFTREESDQVLKQAFQKEFETLGPSILRIGHTMIRALDAPLFRTEDPVLRRRFETLKSRCQEFYYVITGIQWLLPTQSMKQQAQEVIEAYRKWFGPRTPVHWMAACGAYIAGNVERLRLKWVGEAHNPKAMKISCRMSPVRLREMECRIRSIFRSRGASAVLQHAHGQAALSLHFSGRIREKTMKLLHHRLSANLPLKVESVRIHLGPLTEFREETLGPFLERLSHRCEHIQIHCQEAHRRRLEFLRDLRWGCPYQVATA